MAGVYQPGIGCAVVTQGATEPLAEIHHRQPVLLDQQHLDAWLNSAQSSEELPTLKISLLAELCSPREHRHPKSFQDPQLRLLARSPTRQTATATNYIWHPIFPALRRAARGPRHAAHCHPDAGC